MKFITFFTAKLKFERNEILVITVTINSGSANRQFFGVVIDDPKKIGMLNYTRSNFSLNY